MPDVPLTAVVLPRLEAAAAVARAWDRGRAVAVLDPAAPTAQLERALHALAPTAVHTAAGVEPRPGGVPAPPGTAAVVLTSGTTGEPKLVELSFEGLDAIGRGFAAALGTDDRDRVLVCLPLHHVAGLAILARARLRDTPVVVHPAFDVDAVATAPAREGATMVSLVPTMLARLLAAGAPVGEYRALVLGGAPLPDVVRARASEAGATVVDAYGLSETWGGVVLDGVPIAGAEVSLAFGDGDAAPGEILVRGPMVTTGYRGDPDATAAAFTSDGRFRTGDLGAVVDGRVRVVDRLKDVVVTGGVNVSPTAVEAALVGAPGVADVCVAGAPDDEWGERVVAFVVPADAAAPPTLVGLRKHAGDRLGRAEMPKEVVLVEEIPRSPGGKALRRQLRPPP